MYDSSASRQEQSSPLRLWLFCLVFLAVLSCFQAQNCILTVPADPLSAIGLATPYLVTGCTQTPLNVMGTATFVQATIVDMDTGNLFAYTPLILAAAAPNNVFQIAPVVPALPANFMIGLWFGTNGNTLTLQGTMTTNAATNTMLDSVGQGNCVNGGGTPWSIFGQFASCNGAQFFKAVYDLVNKGLITKAVQVGTAPLKPNQVPQLGVDVNGDPCPTTHSFSIVDQDQSDNTDAKYLIIAATGNLAVSTVKNKATLTNMGTAFTEFDNGSDELLVTLVQTAIGCAPYLIQDLGDPTNQTFTPTVATNEIQATLNMQGFPRAFIPNNDPMVLNTNTGGVDINKINNFRTAVGQSALNTADDASTRIYCNNMYVLGAPAIVKWLPLLVNIPAPDFGVGTSNTLGGLLVGRYGAAVNSPANGGMLNCPALTGLPNPLVGFTGVGAGGPLVCPPPFNRMTCALPATSLLTIPQLLGVAALVPDQTGQFTVDIPAGLTIGANGELGGTVATAGVVPAPATATATNNNAFNLLNFAEGAGAAAGVSLVGALILYFCLRGRYNGKSSTTSGLGRF